MRNKFFAAGTVTGLATGIAALGGGLLGTLAGLGVTILFFIYTILPWAADQTRNAPEWYWVAITMGLVPTIVVLFVAVVIGISIGAVVFSFIALALTGGLATIVAQSKKS